MLNNTSSTLIARFCSINRSLDVTLVKFANSSAIIKLCILVTTHFPRVRPDKELSGPSFRCFQLIAVIIVTSIINLIFILTIQITCL